MVHNCVRLAVITGVLANKSKNISGTVTTALVLSHRQPIHDNHLLVDDEIGTKRDGKSHFFIADRNRYLPTD